VHFREQGEGGSLILIGSPAGQRGNFGQTNYAAAKSGIVAFARTWAQELGRANVTVNAVIPTAWTAMTQTIPMYAPLAERLAAGGELPAQVRQAHAIGTPEDCAALVVFLASEAARGVTGQAVGIGGDRLALWSHSSEAAVALRDGGWSPEAIARNWEASVGAVPESYGIRLPPLQLDETEEATS
jgi:NAD(P)-dependent dehydrogenase (short-subunit alcohol dehydrogenase family)